MTAIILNNAYGLPSEQVSTLETITADIHARARQSGENYLRIGQRLIEAKGLLEPGEFLRWLQESTGLSERTAQRMMKVAKSFRPDTVSDLKPAVLIELSHGNVPEEARQEAIDSAKNGQPVTKAAAREIVARHSTRNGTELTAAKSEQIADLDRDDDPARQFYEGDPTDAEPIADDDWEEAEQEEADAEPAPPFDDSRIIKQIGPLARLLDDRAAAYGRSQSPGHSRCLEKVNELISAFHEWQAESAGDAESSSLNEAAAPFVSMIRELGMIKSRAERLAESRPKDAAWFAGYQLDDFKRRITNAQGTLNVSKPVAVCIRCHGEGCRACRNSGFVNQSTLDASPTTADVEAVAARNRKPEPVARVIRDGGLEI